MYRALCVSHLPFLFNCTYDVLILLDLIDVHKTALVASKNMAMCPSFIYLAREEFSHFSIYNKENLPQKF